MYKIIFIFSLFMNQAALGSPFVCPDGVWDLGPGAAALNLDCIDSETTRLEFCKREVVASGRPCNPVGLPINCKLNNDKWMCADNGEQYTAEIWWLSATTIRFEFKSSFSTGGFDGKRF